MDTTNNPRPAWAQKGTIVNVHGHHWSGKIIDVAVSDNGLVLLLIDSPKADFFGHAPEWLVYDPQQIAPGSEDDLYVCLGRYLDMSKNRTDKMCGWYETEVAPEAKFEWPDEKV